MKFLKRVLPNLSISLTLALTVLVILDWYNPMLGFLSGLYFHIFFGLCALANLLTAAVLYGWSRRARRRRRHVRRREEPAPER